MIHSHIRGQHLATKSLFSDGVMYICAPDRYCVIHMISTEGPEHLAMSIIVDGTFRPLPRKAFTIILVDV